MPPPFLTLEGYHKLQEEFEYLKTIKRREIAERLHDALDGGELIENAEYEAAKNEQAFVEGRIQELDSLLANARVIEENGNREVVDVGAKVTLQEEGMEPEFYTIVGAVEADPRNGRISNESPLGRSLMEHRAGDSVKVVAPGGTFTVKILKVE